MKEEGGSNSSEVSSAIKLLLGECFEPYIMTPSPKLAVFSSHDGENRQAL
jgi:hypothetical protein